MPATEVNLFQNEDGTVPLIEWLDKLPEKVQDKCLVKIKRLEEQGHELHRPESDSLRDGIHELRVAFRGMQYRMLYFFHGQQAVISHGLKKESVVPSQQIDLAIVRRARFESNPMKHTYREAGNEG
jgi:phage-related protein